MLDSTTKRRIDACRDILVGKIPDPKGQVEQITLALMYKFMNDMDRESTDLGGKPLFFAKGYAKYSWDRITDQRLAGVERIKLYAEGIEKINKNEAAPELFREIFKNAFLPYRDPETFNLFSKEISAFRYEHSEDLGDAFEYLLSIMSSQGEAGQFRTPRHIIDFMVEVARPRIGEKVLDPACGTGGFLVSAFRHMKAEAGARPSPRKLEELKRSIAGYDISPDMVRLSRVNLYLHQFPEPLVHEYDTLTDTARWEEKADLILANPPFMTPKGGIRPHRKFAIKASRSEVLFVDYMLEHLNADGRAAIIVPEGIIFQSATAYRSLRKILLGGYLWAVASLPAGVFNPYSGVKTSILFIDRKLAQRRGPILFAKIETDGYDLGAQRRPNGKDDLPAALKLLHSTYDRLSSGEIPADYHGRADKEASLDHLLVPAALIEAEPDLSLSMERYRPKEKRGKQKWPMVKLGDVCEIERGASPRPIEKYLTTDTKAPYWIKIGDGQVGEMYISDANERVTIEGASKSRRVNTGDLILSNSMSFGRPYILKISGYIHDGWLALRNISTKVNKEFLYYCLSSALIRDQFKKLATGGVVNNLNSKLVRGVEIPLPSLDTQLITITEINRYQSIIDGARAVVENWKPSFAIDPEWPIARLGDICVFISGFAFKSENMTKEKKGPDFVPVVKIGNIDNGAGINIEDISYHQMADDLKRFVINKGDILIALTGATVGKVCVSQHDGLLLNQRVGLVRANQHANQEYIRNILQDDNFYKYCQRTAGGGAQGNISPSEVLEYEIPFPTKAIQKQIASRIESERELVKANEKLIGIMQARIDETIARIWE